MGVTFLGFNVRGEGEVGISSAGVTQKERNGAPLEDGGGPHKPGGGMGGHHFAQSVRRQQWSFFFYMKKC